MALRTTRTSLEISIAIGSKVNLDQETHAFADPALQVLPARGGVCPGVGGLLYPPMRLRSASMTMPG